MASPASRQDYLARLGAVLNTERTDIPEIYLVRVADRACKDLGFNTLSSDLNSLSTQHKVFAKFVSEFASHPTNISHGRSIGTVGQTGIERVRAGKLRIGVWWDNTNWTEWCCRALALAKYDDEDKLYDEFDRLHDVGRFLPTSAERTAAIGDHYLACLVDAFCQAMKSADTKAGQWQPVIVRHGLSGVLGGRDLNVGRVCVMKEQIDASGALVTRFLLLLTESPLGVRMREDWKGYLLSTVLPAHEPIMPVYSDLPPGANKRPGEVAMVQEVPE
jgi:hypothetical protein